MRAVATILLAASVLVSASEGPARLPFDSDTPAITIPISKRANVRRPRLALSQDGVADLSNLQNALYVAGRKFTTGARRYWAHTGHKLPGYDTMLLDAEKSCTKFAQHKLAQLGLTKRQSGEAQLINQQDGLLWSGALAIGSNKQQFNVNFDTGSSDFWVADQSINNGHATFNCAASTTCKGAGSSFRVTYGDSSSVGGPVYTDNVVVAGLTSIGQGFSAATFVSEEMTDDPSDGIVGLGWPAISNMNKPTLFQQLYTQRAIGSNMFSFKLGRADEGSLTLGGQDTTEFTGAMTWTPVTQKAYWMIKGTVSVGTNVTATNVNMIVDTGTTLIIMPPSMAAAFFARVPGARPYGTSGYYMYQCARRWTAYFSFPGSTTRYAVSSEFMNLGRTQAGSLWCVAGVASQNVGVSAIILGDVFLRNVYTSFDAGAARVGFAKLA